MLISTLKSILCLFMVTVFQYTLVQNWLIPDDDDCLTPNRKLGLCISIKQCKPIINLIKEKPLKSEVVSFVRQSQCDFIGKEPKVCCPKNGETAGRITTPAPLLTTSRNLDEIHSDLLPKVTQCGLGTSNRIYGGEIAEIDDFPWMALLEYQKPNGRGFYCGGVLINNRYVLTAAHCLIGKDIPQDWSLDSVRLGEYDTTTNIDCISDSFNGNTQFCAPPPIDVKIEKQIPHPQYKPNDVNQYNDIGLIRLAKHVPYTDFIQPICLPTTIKLLQQTYEGGKLFVAGWGKTETRSASPIKMKVQLPVFSNTECKNIYRTTPVRFSSSQMCAGGEHGKDSCRGDSGGPLMALNKRNNNYYNWYAVAVVSFGPIDCGLRGWPGVYTKVSSYMNWIVSNIYP